MLSKKNEIQMILYNGAMIDIVTYYLIVCFIVNYKKAARLFTLNFRFTLKMSNKNESKKKRRTRYTPKILKWQYSEMLSCFPIIFLVFSRWNLHIETLIIIIIIITLTVTITISAILKIVFDWFNIFIIQSFLFRRFLFQHFFFRLFQYIPNFHFLEDMITVIFIDTCIL